VKINPQKSKQGFTLMELLCVMAILAILLALYLPSLARAFKHAKNVLFGQ